MRSAPYVAPIVGRPVVQHPIGSPTTEIWVADREWWRQQHGHCRDVSAIVMARGERDTQNAMHAAHALGADEKRRAATKERSADVSVEWRGTQWNLRFADVQWGEDVHLALTWWDMAGQGGDACLQSMTQAWANHTRCVIRAAYEAKGCDEWTTVTFSINEVINMTTCSLQPRRRQSSQSSGSITCTDCSTAPSCASWNLTAPTWISENSATVFQTALAPRKSSPRITTIPDMPQKSYLCVHSPSSRHTVVIKHHRPTWQNSKIKVINSCEYSALDLAL